MKRFLPLLFALVLALPVVAQNRRAPGFSLPDSSQKQYDLYDYRGKVVLLDILQTTCPHCQELTAALEKLKSKYGSQVQILSIVVPPDTAANVKKYIADHKVTTPIVFDCGQVTFSYLRSAANIKLPQLFVIDKAGVIRNQLSGDANLTEKAIAAAVDPLLK